MRHRHFRAYTISLILPTIKFCNLRNSTITFSTLTGRTPWPRFSKSQSFNRPATLPRSPFTLPRSATAYRSTTDRMGLFRPTVDNDILADRALSSISARSSSDTHTLIGSSFRRGVGFYSFAMLYLSSFSTVASATLSLAEQDPSSRRRVRGGGGGRSCEAA